MSGTDQVQWVGLRIRLALRFTQRFSRPLRALYGLKFIIAIGMQYMYSSVYAYLAWRPWTPIIAALFLSTLWAEVLPTVKE